MLYCFQIHPITERQGNGIMLLSASSFLAAQYGFESTMDLYKKAGFTAIDCGLNGMTNDADPFCGDGWRERAEEIRRYADKIGLPINQSHAPFSWGNDRWNDPAYYETVIAPRVLRSIAIAGIFGVKVLVIHPRHQYVYPGHEDEIFEINMKYYRELIPYAEEAGIKIGVENMWQIDPRRRHICADTCSKIPDFIRYIDTLDSDRITACLDIGHTVLVEQQDEPWDFIRALGHDRLGALHVHDTDYRADLHYLPYMAQIDWNKVTEALGEIDYAGDLTYECSGPMNYKIMDPEMIDIMLKLYVDVGNHLISKIEKSRPAH